MGTLEMIYRIITSNVFAVGTLIVAAASLGLLYWTGKTSEAMIGAGVLFLAGLLIFIGMRSKG